MPKLDGTGPDGTSPKAGRKLGNCQKTADEALNPETIGKGQGKRRHSTKNKNEGKGKRLKYNQSI